VAVTAEHHVFVKSGPLMTGRFRGSLRLNAESCTSKSADSATSFFLLRLLSAYCAGFPVVGDDEKSSRRHRAKRKLATAFFAQIPAYHW
jgi:hypothetical protein